MSLHAELSEADASLVREGSAVTFRADTDTQEHGGTVASIAKSGGTTSVGIRPDETLDEAQRGQSVRVSIAVKSTSGEVLAVPLAAISGTADGLARITKVATSGNTEVKVRAGLSADGYVEVVPVDVASLAPGDLVVLG
jgi:hypothetical protein